MTFNSLSWFDTNLFPWIFLSFISSALVVYLWRNGFHTHLGLRKYRAIQRIHLDEVPRLGGLVLVLCFMGYLLNHSADENLKAILFSLCPVIIFSLKEDLFHNVRPMVRLSSLLVSSLIFIYLHQGPWPVIDLPILQGALSTT